MVKVKVSLSYDQASKNFQICGKTYQHRIDFKQILRADWDQDLKCWLVPEKFIQDFQEYFNLTSKDLRSIKRGDELWRMIGPARIEAKSSLWELFRKTKNRGFELIDLKLMIAEEQPNPKTTSYDIYGIPWTLKEHLKTIGGEWNPDQKSWENITEYQAKKFIRTFFNEIPEWIWDSNGYEAEKFYLPANEAESYDPAEIRELLADPKSISDDDFEELSSLIDFMTVEQVLESADQNYAKYFVSLFQIDQILPEDWAYIFYLGLGLDDDEIDEPSQMIITEARSFHKDKIKRFIIELVYEDE